MNTKLATPGGGHRCRLVPTRHGLGSLPVSCRCPNHHGKAFPARNRPYIRPNPALCGSLATVISVLGAQAPHQSLESKTRRRCVADGNGYVLMMSLGSNELPARKAFHFKSYLPHHRPSFDAGVRGEPGKGERGQSHSNVNLSQNGES